MFCHFTVQVAPFCPGDLNQLQHRPVDSTSGTAYRTTPRKTSASNRWEGKSKDDAEGWAAALSLRASQQQYSDSFAGSAGDRDSTPRKKTQGGSEGKGRGGSPATRSQASNYRGGGVGSAIGRRWAPQMNPVTPDIDDHRRPASPLRRGQSPLGSHPDRSASVKPQAAEVRAHGHHPTKQTDGSVQLPEGSHRDTLGYMIKTPWHYRVSQFYDHQSSPFKSQGSSGRNKGGPGALPTGPWDIMGIEGHSGKAKGKRGTGVGLNRPVSEEAARVASEAGVHPAHIQMAKEVLEVGTAHEGGSAAAAAASSGQRGGHGAGMAKVPEILSDDQYPSRLVIITLFHLRGFLFWNLDSIIISRAAA